MKGHTPGPWRMEPRSINGQLQHWGITDGTGFDIATTITDDNAALIASAGAADALEAIWNDGGHERMTDATYRMMQDALRSAKRLP